MMRDESRFLSGRRLTTPPRVFIGAAENPFAPPYDFRVLRLAKKIAAGAQFVQTQYCFDLPLFRRFMAQARDMGLDQQCFILVGVGPIASARTARWMRANVAGVHIPDAVIARLEGAADPRAEGKRICVEMIQALARGARRRGRACDGLPAEPVCRRDRQRIRGPARPRPLAPRLRSEYAAGRKPGGGMKAVQSAKPRTSRARPLAEELQRRIGVRAQRGEGSAPSAGVLGCSVSRGLWRGLRAAFTFLSRTISHDRHHRLLRHEGSRHRLRASLRDDRRAHQPDRPQVARGRNDGGRLQPRGRRGAGPGRGGGADARRQRRHSARRRAQDPRRMHQARSGDGRRAALDRLLPSSRRWRPGSPPTRASRSSIRSPAKRSGSSACCRSSRNTAPR